MNNSQEALKMVNNILEDEMWFPNKYPDQAIPVCFIETIKACKEALAELQEQKPVAWLSTDSKANEIIKTHPATWQGLSDDERHEMIVKHVAVDCTCDPYEFARAIEQALKEKNT